MQRNLLVYFEKLMRELRTRRSASSFPDDQFYAVTMLSIQVEKYHVLDALNRAVSGIRLKRDAVKLVRRYHAAVRKLSRSIPGVFLKDIDSDVAYEVEPPSWEYMYYCLHCTFEAMRERIEMDFHTCIDPASLPENLMKWEGYKIATGLSAPQFACIVKVLCKRGVFKKQNVTKMMEFFSMFFTTSGTEQLSAGSLQRKFYRVDASVLDSVRDILIGLRNELKKK